MKLGYVWWGFHRLIRRSPVYRVLDGSGVTSSTAGLFVQQDVLFQMAMKHNSFFTWRNSLEVFCPLIP